MRPKFSGLAALTSTEDMEESDVEDAEGLGESMGETAAEDSVESLMLRRRAFAGRGMAVEAMVKAVKLT